jgi:ABC-type lipoprotein release transport system permease subunit
MRSSAYANPASGGPRLDAAADTPLRLLVLTIVFSLWVRLLSGLSPALRAATLVPVNALKYE